MEFLVTPASISQTFADLCRRYDECRIVSAWCGSPEYEIPYSHLGSLKRIHAIIGSDFHHTHPAGIKKMIDICDSLRIMKSRNGATFHPKVYLFSKGPKLTRKYAALLGSANLTLAAFTANDEVCVRLDPHDLSKATLKSLEQKISEWSSSKRSFFPSQKWLKNYAAAYARHKKKRKNAGVRAEPDNSGNPASASWLVALGWDEYLKQVKRKLCENYEMKPSDHSQHHPLVLKEFKRRVKFPFKTSYFDDDEIRRLLNGIGRFGAFGHIGASGRVLHLFANGTEKQKKMMARIFTRIKRLKTPIDYEHLRLTLKELTALGVTMRSWGRLLSIIRPDIFFTVSHAPFRKALGDAIGMSASKLPTVEGYIQAHRFIMQAPWVNQAMPEGLNAAERFIWKNRVAYVDPLLLCKWE